MKPPPPPLPPLTELIRLAGGEVDKSCVSLRFFHEDLDPEEISSLLQVEPSTAYRKGDVIPDKRYHRVRKYGGWMLSGQKRTDKTLEE